jgi:hypothetical protein
MFSPYRELTNICPFFGLRLLTLPLYENPIPHHHPGLVNLGQGGINLGQGQDRKIGAGNLGQV